MLALVTVKNEEAEQSRLGRPLRDRHGRDRAQADPRARRTLRILVQGLAASRLERRVRRRPVLVGEFARCRTSRGASKELEA
jgi:hypothetical protein